MYYTLYVLNQTVDFVHYVAYGIVVLAVLSAIALYRISSK